jgi:hypothetical protein
MNADERGPDRVTRSRRLRFIENVDAALKALIEQTKQTGHMTCDGSNRVGAAAKDNYGQRQLAEVLLFHEVLIDSHKGIKPSRGQSQQFAVRFILPSNFVGGADGVP